MTEFDAKYYLNQGIEKTNKGNFIAALEDFDKSLELDAKKPLTYFSKAIVFHNLKRLEEAFENYSRAIELDEKMVDAYYNRAHVVLLKENPGEAEYKKALRDFEEAMNLDNKFIDALYYAAVMNMKLKRYETSVEYLDKLLAIEPDAIQSRALKKLILQKYLK